MVPISSNQPLRLTGVAPVAAAPAAQAPTVVVPAPGPVADQGGDISYEPVWASALRKSWDWLSGLFGSDTNPEEPVGGGAGTVTVQRGDSLSKIAQRALGDGNRWREIYDANRDTISNPNIIHPGQVLRLPGASAPAPAPQPAPQPSGSYTVRGGDTLSKIAQRSLGDAGRWQELYNLNRDKISNPNIVWPGMTLRLPGGAQAAPTPAPQAPSATSGKMAWPVRGRLTSPFGMRRHPITGQNKLHTGLDIAAATGTPITSPRSGTVTFAGWSGGYGNYVVVDHGNGMQTAYAHMSAISVRKGQRLEAGTQVGKVGSTGMSTGPHLHFEVKRNGQFVNPQSILA
jgi:murein DD-endopeptidase MepM/ murein hydrolase activator NlpD